MNKVIITCNQLLRFLTVLREQRNRSSNSKETNDLPIKVIIKYVLVIFNAIRKTRFTLCEINTKMPFKSYRIISMKFTVCLLSSFINCSL